MSDPAFAGEQTNRWEAVHHTIRTMPIEQQALYADYVCNKICELPANQIVPFIKDQFDNNHQIDGPFRGAASAANVAKMILTLPEGEYKQNAKLRFAQGLQL